MYFPSAIIVLAGLSTLTAVAAAYDDGMYHPGTTTVASQEPPPATYPTSEATSYPKSTYMGYWSSNSTTTMPPKSITTESSMSTNTSHTMSEHTGNMTTYMRPANGSMTMTMAAGRIYTTTICDLESSCHVTVVTATGSIGMTRSADIPQPTMTPFSSSERLLASGWSALALCGIALLL